MRTTEARHRSSRPPTAASVAASAPVVRIVAWGAGLAIVLAGLAAPAVADKPDRPTYPTRGEVEAAESDAQDAEARVAQLQADLALANQRLEAAAVAAEQAYEAYNGARWLLSEAGKELRLARADARRAERQVARQRERLAGLVAASYQDGGDVSAVNAVLGSAGPAGLMSQLLAFEGASSSLEGEFQRFGATASLAEVFREQAEDARDERLDALEAAELAKDAATAAAAAAQQVAAETAAEKDRLLAEMARLQGISVALAEQRQNALEEIERERAAREAAELLASQPEPVVPEGPGPTQPQPVQPQPTQPDPTHVPTPDSGPAPGPTPGPAPAPSGGAGRALQFARAQLGEPYVWGAAGPNAWDCSGLTMRAWQAGGVSLPHYSVAQYDAATPISAAQLRPGDLVFWGSSSSPSSIHHVALYLGDGMIIHAPRTGRPVSIDSMYYWVPPNFFGRV